MFSARVYTRLRVTCTSSVYESRHPGSESRPWRVALGPWRRPMASRTSSVRVNDDPDGQVNLRYLPEADMYVGMSLHLGQCSRCDTTWLPCWCKALELRVRTRRAAL